MSEPSEVRPAVLAVVLVLHSGGVPNTRHTNGTTSPAGIDSGSGAGARVSASQLARQLDAKRGVPASFPLPPSHDRDRVTISDFSRPLLVSLHDSIDGERTRGREEERKKEKKKTSKHQRTLWPSVFSCHD